AIPVRVVHARSGRVALGDGGLQHVVAATAVPSRGCRVRAGERLYASRDLATIPPGAVLVRQQDRAAIRRDASAKPRGLELHQRHETVRLGLVRYEPGQDTTQSQRFECEVLSDPAVARR